MSTIKIKVLNRSVNTQSFLLENGVSAALIDDIESFEIDVTITNAARITDSQASRKPEVNGLKAKL